MTDLLAYEATNPETGEVETYRALNHDQLAQVAFLPGVRLRPEQLEFLASKLGKRAVELPDPTPLEPPLGYVRQDPLHVKIANMIRSEISRVAGDNGMETLDEADDFDVGDDWEQERSTPYEEVFDTPAVAQTRQEVLEAERKAAEALKNAPPQGASPEDAKPAPEAPPAKPS